MRDEWITKELCKQNHAVHNVMNQLDSTRLQLNMLMTTGSTVAQKLAVPDLRVVLTGNSCSNEQQRNGTQCHPRHLVPVWQHLFSGIFSNCSKMGQVN